MSDQVIASLCIGVPAALTGMAAFVTSLRNGRKLREVHDIVNSKETVMSNRLEAQGKEITRLSELVAKLIGEKAVLEAQSEYLKEKD